MSLRDVRGWQCDGGGNAESPCRGWEYSAAADGQPTDGDYDCCGTGGGADWDVVSGYFRSAYKEFCNTLV